MNEDQLT